MRNISTLIGMWLLMMLFPAFGYPIDINVDPIDKELQECNSKNPSTQGMNNCTIEAYDRWDKVINDTYKKLMNKLDKDSKIALKNSQREWIKYKDAEFKFIGAYYDNFQGTMYSNMNHGDNLDFVRSRALKLRSYLSLIDMK